MTFTFSWAGNYQSEQIFDNTIIIADSSDFFEHFSENSMVCSAAKLDDSNAKALISMAGSKLSPGQDSGSTSELFVIQGESLRRFVVGRMASACSRHNTPSRSHSVGNMVKTSKGSGNLQIILAPSDVSHIFAQCCAVSRHFPLFSMKSSGNADVSVDVVVHFPGLDATYADNMMVEVAHTVDSIRLAQRLVDTPANILHTSQYVQEAIAVATELGCQITVIEGKELEERGFGGIWGVGKASKYPPALVILTHCPVGCADQSSICMVGKGIVYDTGGLSLKTPSPMMCGMKMDMGGSAAVLGAFKTAVRSNLNQRIHALLCLAENSVSADSTRPDDIHKFLSGKTVEVNNTDAEGRLVLADGCFYAASQLQPKLIIDIATLTGAQLISTGKNHGAIYCNDDEIEASAIAVGKQTGDLVFPIPYCPEFYRNEFRSKVADMKNSVADRSNAQSSCAGQFIGNHIEDYLNNGGKWLHVDMAGPAFIEERGTGYGVALLYGMLKKHSS